MFDEFLNVVQAEDDGLLTVDITIDDFDADKKDVEERVATYFEEIKVLYHRVSVIDWRFLREREKKT